MRVYINHIYKNLILQDTQIEFKSFINYYNTKNLAQNNFYDIMDKKIKDFIERWKKRLRFPKLPPPTCPA